MLGIEGKSMAGVSSRKRKLFMLFFGTRLFFCVMDQFFFFHKVAVEINLYNINARV